MRPRDPRAHALAVRGVGAYGHKIRRATADERIGGTDLADGAYVTRGCRRRCGDAVEFVCSFFLEDADHRPRLYRHYVCARHAARFATRHALALPPPLATDQQLLPFTPRESGR